MTRKTHLCLLAIIGTIMMIPFASASHQEAMEYRAFVENAVGTGTITRDTTPFGLDADASKSATTLDVVLHFRLDPTGLAGAQLTFHISVDNESVFGSSATFLRSAGGGQENVRFERSYDLDEYLQGFHTFQINTTVTDNVALDGESLTLVQTEIVNATHDAADNITLSDHTVTIENEEISLYVPLTFFGIIFLWALLNGYILVAVPPFITIFTLFTTDFNGVWTTTTGVVVTALFLILTYFSEQRGYGKRIGKGRADDERRGGD